MTRTQATRKLLTPEQRRQYQREYGRKWRAAHPDYQRNRRAAHPECDHGRDRREYHRQWYHANRERRLESSRKYRLEHLEQAREKGREYKHKYYLANREKINERDRRRYAANPLKQLAYNRKPEVRERARKWRAENSDRVREYERKHRAILAIGLKVLKQQGIKIKGQKERERAARNIMTREDRLLALAAIEARRNSEQSSSNTKEN